MWEDTILVPPFVVVVFGEEREEKRDGERARREERGERRREPGESKETRFALGKFEAGSGELVPSGNQDFPPLSSKVVQTKPW